MLSECPTSDLPATTVRPSPARRPATLRSGVTNGSRQFIEGDEQSPWARRRRDLQELYEDDIGGTSNLTEIQRGLVATAATLRTELEAIEGRLSQGVAVDLDAYARAAGHYRRIVETLGIKRQTRDITVPSVNEYLANKRRGA